MGLKNEMVRQGNLLFRWRSYLPIVFLLPLAIGLATMKWPFGSYAIHEYWEFTCFAISLFGVAIRCWTIGHTPAGTSGRNTHDQVAEQLNTTGIYSLVRHPLYVGNFLIGFGAVIVPMELWLACVYVLLFWIYYERIMFAEEAFLYEKFGDRYTEWALRTPAFVPRFRNWMKPVLKFSLRNVLKREYTGFALAVVLHAGIEAIEHLVIDHRFKVEWVWVAILALTGVSYFLLRWMKKNTGLLHVEGR